MAKRIKAQDRNLKTACWGIGKTVTAVCVDLGISRNTAYEAFKDPKKFPKAAPKLFAVLDV